MTTVLSLNPGESRKDFIARIIAASRPPSPEGMAELRRLLPPVSQPVAERRAS